MIRLVRAPLAAVLAFVEEWQPATTPRRTMQDAVDELNAYEAEHETLPESDFHCVVDDCTYRPFSANDQNQHSYQEHLQPNPFKVSGDPLVSYHRYPGVSRLGDFKWFNITITKPSSSSTPQSSPVSPAGDLPLQPAQASGSAAEVSVDPPTPSAAPSTFTDWATPAICDVLAGHEAYDYAGGIECQHDSGFPASLSDWESWREHVAPLIAQRLEAAGAQHTPK